MNRESETINKLFMAKEDFVIKLKELLVTDTLRNFVIESIPEELNNDRDFDSSSFREKFNSILSPLSAKIVDNFQNVGSFKTGKVFSNIVNAIDHASKREGEFRVNKFLHDAQLHNLDLKNTNGDELVSKTFESLNMSPDIGSAFKKDLSFILTTEDVQDVIEDIKENVKNSIAETQIKQELVKATNQEILDYKREIAPPDNKVPTPINHDSDDIHPELNEQDAVDPNMIDPKYLNDKDYYQEDPADDGVESFSQKWLPTHATVFADMELPDKYLLASEMFRVSADLSQSIDQSMNALRYSLKNSAIISKESVPVLQSRIDDYHALAKEAYQIARMWGLNAQKLGITQNGLLNSQENTIGIANNIISRFITNEKTIYPEPLPYISNENLLNNAFDLMQFRQILDASPYSPAVTEEYLARENVFFKELLKWNDKDVKEKAQAVIDMSKMKVINAFTPKFLKDVRLKVWEMTVKPNINPDAHAEVTRRVTETFENFWKRPLNEDEKKIIQATVNEEDVTEICPTPFEQFVIQLTNDHLENNTKAQEAFIEGETSENTRESIFSNALLLTSLYMTTERFGILPDNKYNSFLSFRKLFSIKK